MLSENNNLSAQNKKLEAMIDRLENEVASSKQEVSSLQIDKETRASRLADLEALLKSKDEINKSLENKEKNYEVDINDLRNEVIRLSGVESLLNDRNEILKDENELLENKARDSEINLDALREEIADLRKLSNELKFEVARKNENAENMKSINSDLRRDLENLDLQNQELKYSESAMKGELSSLKSELTSLGIEESRISEQLIDES